MRHEFQPGTVPRRSATEGEITVHIDTPATLFNAPSVNPFSDLDVDVLGEPALTRVAKRLRSREARHARRLVIVLPADEMTPGLETRIRRAIKRFTTMRIRNNDLETVARRSYGWKGLLLALPTTLVIALIAYGIYSVANLAGTAATALTGFTGIVLWVILWTPIELLAFDWIPRAQENAILRKIRAMSIEVRAASS